MSGIKHGPSCKTDAQSLTQGLSPTRISSIHVVISVGHTATTWGCFMLGKWCSKPLLPMHCSHNPNWPLCCLGIKFIFILLCSPTLGLHMYFHTQRKQNCALLVDTEYSGGVASLYLHVFVSKKVCKRSKTKASWPVPKH